MEDNLTNSFVCSNCNRKRTGKPEVQTLVQGEICHWCALSLNEMLKKMNRRKVTARIEYARPHEKDCWAPELSRYRTEWDRRKGLCTGCHVKHYHMFAVWTKSGKIKGLKCADCYSKTPKDNFPDKKWQIPRWWRIAPWYVREFMWQNPSVRAEIEARCSGTFPEGLDKTQV